MSTMVPIFMRLILETDQEQNARSVLTHLGQHVDFELRSLAPYSKGGYEANLTVQLTAATWPEIVYRVIALAQSVSCGWELNGSIEDGVDAGIDLVSNARFRISGIKFAWISCQKPDQK